MRNKKIKIAALALLTSVISLTPFVLRELSKVFIINGVQIASLEIGGLDYTEANKKVDTHYQSLLDSTVEVDFNGTKITTTLRELGVEFDSYRTTELAFNHSYGEDTIAHLSTRLKSMVIPTQIMPQFRIDEDKMEDKINELVPAIKTAKDARISIGRDGKAIVNKHEAGLKADYQDVYSQIAHAVEILEIPEVNLKTEKLEAEYTEYEAFEDAQIWRSLLEQEVTFTYNHGLDFEATTSIQSDWVSVRRKQITFNQGAIENYLETIAPAIDLKSEDASIISLPAEDGLSYAEVDNIAKNGRKLNRERSAKKIIEKLKNNEHEISLEVDTIIGQVVNLTSENLGTLQLLAQGKSNFAGSPGGRSFNINKGLSEKMNNILLAPGEEFSFNSYLGPVTYSRGWQDSLAIFGGRDLRPVPGGGLCQVSTTIYRAALNAGLSIKEQYNHSLYVHYYRAYGDGLDSTIFPGIKDLKFVNDTDNYILVQAYTDGNDAYANFYGTHDGRSISLDGPFYKNKIPDEFKETLPSLRWNEIAWIQTITYPTGEEKQEVLMSRYNTAPY